MVVGDSLGSDSRDRTSQPAVPCALEVRVSLLLIALSLAGPAEATAWTTVTEKNGCTFSKAPPEGDLQPLRAECRWSISPDKLQGMLADWEAHAGIFGTVASSKVIGSEGGAKRVQQTHVSSGISDRFIVLAGTDEPIDGGHRYSFRMAKDQSEARAAAEAAGGVVPDHDVGLWEIRSDGNWGSIVVHELRYDPGGSVPGFMVRAFQGSGFQDMVGQLKAAAGG